MRLTCCKPHKPPYPSGRYEWTHSRWCELWPNRKVDETPAIEADDPPVKVVSIDQERRRRRPTVVKDARPIVAHPACIAAANDGTATPCSRCSWLLEIDNEGARYVDAHVDDRP